jgi:hypothetical protein
MTTYNALSELIWAKVKCQAEPDSIYAERKTFDDLLAANRIVARDLLIESAESELLWLSERLTWRKYCEFVLIF